jgi:hypothetical protein
VLPDINKSYNPEGRERSVALKKGAVLELKPIFENPGFAWGGRVDPSHFQINNMNKPASEPQLPAP